MTKQGMQKSNEMICFFTKMIVFLIFATVKLMFLIVSAANVANVGKAPKVLYLNHVRSDLMRLCL